MLTTIRARLLLWRSRRWWWIVRTSPARRLSMADRAVALLRRRSPSLALARALTIQGERMVYAGRPVDAEAAAHEALAIIGDGPGLARGGARHVLARALGDLGRHDEAISVGQDALADYGGLKLSARVTGRICAVTYTQTINLDNAGRFEDALRLAEELAERVAAVSPRGMPWILQTWWREKCHRAGLLSRAGRCQEAVTVGQDILGLINIGVRLDPSWRPTRATLLGYLAQCHGLLGRHDEAASMAARAVADYRALGESFGAGLAWALGMQAERLAELERRREADDAWAEACSVYAALEANEPDAYRDRLYGALNNRDEALWVAGEREASVSLEVGALPDVRRFAVADPERYRPILATWLTMLAMRSTVVGRIDGPTYADEAVAIARKLAAEASTPAADGGHDALLAWCLKSRALVLHQLRLAAPTLESASEAAAIRRRLARTDPATHEDDLIASLELVATALFLLDRDEESVATWHEVLEILRRRGDDPHNRAEVAATLHRLALALSALHRHGEAIDALTECIDHRRRLLETDDTPKLAAATADGLRRRSFDLNAIRREDEAVRDIEEAVAIFRRLAAADPDTYGAQLERAEREAAERAAGRPPS